MTERLYSLLRCPVTGGLLKLEIFVSAASVSDGRQQQVIQQGVLISEEGLYFPVVDGIPRMTLNAFLEYKDFLQKHLADYSQVKQRILASRYAGQLSSAAAITRKTSISFEYEWSMFDPGKDRTWDQDKSGMIDRFFKETRQDCTTLPGKLILDAGCGNGLLDLYIAELGAEVVAMDLTRSIERAASASAFPNAMCVQGDVLHPPFEPGTFDMVHSSGVLVAVAKPEDAFRNLVRYVRPHGLLSVWLYHPQRDRIHNFMLAARPAIVNMPPSLQRIMINYLLLPLSFAVKKLKGNRQNIREMRIDLLDHFTPEYRWEFTQEQVLQWFRSAGCADASVTTLERFGFNTTGTIDGPVTGHTLRSETNPVIS